MPVDLKDTRVRRHESKKLLSEAPEKPALTSGMDTERLIHELSVHQIELETLNEELRASRERLEESRSVYAELYDFAPVGYLTFDTRGIITRANLTSCGLLGTERNLLLKKPFALFVNPGSKNLFYFHKRQVLGTTTKQSSQLVLKRKDGTSFDVQMESIAVQINGHPAVHSILTDITERKAEEALRRYELLFRNSRDIVLLVRCSDGRILDANDAAASAYGRGRDELLTLSINDLRGEGTRGLTADQMARADGGGILFETIHRRRDGSTFPVEVSSQGAAIDGARTLISVIRDITERRRAEEAAWESRERFRVLADATFEGIAFAEAGRILEVNDQFARILGYEKNELIGAEVFSLVHPEDRPRVMETIKEGRDSVIEHRFIRKDGVVITVEAHGKPFTYEGRDARMTALRDITDRKKAEGALRESQSRLETVFAAIPDLIVEYDTDGRLVRANEAALRAARLNSFHFARDQLVEKLKFTTLGGGAVRIEDLPTSRALRGETVAGDLYSIRTADGFDRVVSTYASPLFKDGKVNGAVAVWHDITDLKRADDALRKARDELELRVEERTEELRKAYETLRIETEERQRAETGLRQAHKMEALGTLAGGIAHDFNNILAAIIGFSEMAIDKAGEGLPVRGHMERVLAAGLRGRELVKRILTFSRRAEQEKRPLKLVTVAKEALGLLRPSLPGTVDIRVNLGTESGFVLGDSTQIQQVLMNLCTNAAHAVRQRGGSISIDLTGFSFSNPEDAPDPTMTPGLYARLSVTDTGEGMSPEIMEHIFEPFFTAKAAGEGTGLGLSVVHGIVASHGGTITVSSEPGKGSTFTVYLPRLPGEQSRDSADEGNSIPRGHETILFVDDEKDLAAMADEMLTDLGYRVTSKTDPREALALFRLETSRFDLVITDQTMPAMTGKDLVDEILAIRADTPIIMCTGFSPVVDADKAAATGIRAFAMKPLTKKETARIIRKVLDE